MTSPPWYQATTGGHNTSDDAVPVEYHSVDYRVVGSLLVGFIFVVGLTGNALVIAVVVRVPSMGTPTNWYLVSLALADIVLLVSAPLPTIVEYHVLVDEWLFGAGGCSLAVFTQYLGVNVSALSMTAFTIERYVAICHPFTTRRADASARAKRVLITVWLAGMAYCTPWLLLATTVPRRLTDGRTISVCTFTLPRSQYLVYYLADLVLFYATPLLTATVLYALIARTLLRRGRRRDNDGATPARRRTVCSAAATRNTSANVQVVKMLVVIVASFAALWLPYRAYVVYNSFARRRYENRWFLLSCRLAVYANSAINPLLYNAMSVRFRLGFKNLLCSSNGRMSERRDVAVAVSRVSPGVSDHPRRSPIELRHMQRVVIKKSSFASVDSAQRPTCTLLTVV